jgi:hypothetical protein
MTGRQFNPQRTIQVEMINHEDATLSPYEAPLKAFGFSKNYKTLELLRRY